MAVPSHPWRPAMCLSARACFYVCVSPLVPLISLFSLARPVCSCRGAGRSVSLSFACRARIVSRVGCDCGLLRDGDECVDFVNCLLSVDWCGRHRVYCISCLVDGASADFVGFLGRCLISSDKAGGFSPPYAPLFFPFFGSDGGDFFYLSHLSLNTYQLDACPSRFAIGWR